MSHLLQFPSLHTYKKPATKYLQDMVDDPCPAIKESKLKGMAIAKIEESGDFKGPPLVDSFLENALQLGGPDSRFEVGATCSTDGAREVTSDDFNVEVSLE